MSIDTTTRPSWLGRLVRYLGPPATHLAKSTALRDQFVWHWDVNETTLVVDRWTDGAASVEVLRNGARIFETRKATGFTDAEMLDVLRLAGLLPPMVRAVDCAVGPWSFDANDTAHRVRPGDDSPAADRPLWVEAAW